MGKKTKRKTNNGGAGRKTVSLCTPTYHRRKFIPFLIKCYLNQTYPQELIEWIVIDDGDDKVEDLCKDLLNIELDKFNQTSDWGTKILSKDQLAYAAQDVLFLHKLKIKLDEILLREGKMNLALECFESLKTRVKLDLEGFQELDIFAH